MGLRTVSASLNLLASPSVVSIAVNGISTSAALGERSQPLVPVLGLDRDHAALVLVIGRQLRIGLVHAAH